VPWFAGHKFWKKVFNPSISSPLSHLRPIFGLSKTFFRDCPPPVPAYIQAVNRKQLARLFARLSRRSPGRAADVIDGLVYRMLKDLKRPFSGPIVESSSAAGTAKAKQERQ
jgi:hypothetical protein